jgi:hypothetical protein
MRHGFFVLFFLVSSVLSFGCGKESQNAEPAKPLEQFVDEVVKKADEEGLLVLDKEAFLGKDLILGAEIRDVTSSPPLNGIGGLVMEFLGTTLVRFEEDKDALLMMKSPYIPWKRLEREHPFERARLTVKSVKDNKITLDANEFGKLLTAQATKGSGVSFSFLKAETREISIDTHHLVIPVDVTLISGNTTIFIRFVVYLKKWEPRETLKRTIDKDFGYFTLFEWFKLGAWEEVDPYKIRAKRLPEDPILAWDVENLASPIEYIITDSVPETYRSLFKEAIESWNLSFRKAGHEKDVVTARIQGKDEKLVIGDPRVHLVYWENDLFRGVSGAHASFQVDPITGEMYHGDVYFGGERLVRNLKKAYEFFYSDEQKNSELFAMLKSSHNQAVQRQEDRQKALEAAKNLLHSSSSLPFTLSFAKMPFQKICGYDVRSIPLDRAAQMTADEFARTWLHEVVIHEVGHNWGLRHNFKGSLGASVSEKRPTNSVMDYNDDQLIVEGLFLKPPGVYDDEAIRYGYPKNPEPQTTYPFCTDEDADDIFDYDFDPRCARYDSGKNPLEDSLIPDLEKIYVKFLLTQDLDDKVRLWRYFFSRFFDSFLYLTRKGTSQDKEFLNASIAKLLDLKEVASVGENTPRDLSKDWIYRFVRPFIADWVLLVASVFMESDDSLHDSFLTSVRRLISGEKEYVSDIDPQTREFLLDDLYRLKNHPSQNIQLRMLDTLLKLKSRLEEERMRLEQSGIAAPLTQAELVRLIDVKRFIELVDNRVKSFFGRDIGDRR